MAEVKNDEEQQHHACATVHAKRKPDSTPVENDKDENGNDDSLKKQKLESSVAEEIKMDGEYEGEEEGDDDEEDYEDEEEDEEEDDEDDEQHSNGKAMVDRKGKGILILDKGKGKLIEESDDSTDGESESDDSSDLSDDPLAEVNLDNILPSRTRRRSFQPGVFISNEIGNNDDDDSNDSDA